MAKVIIAIENMYGAQHTVTVEVPDNSKDPIHDPTVVEKVRKLQKEDNTILDMKVLKDGK